LTASSTIKFCNISNISLQRHTLGFFFFRKIAVAVGSSALSLYGAVVSACSSFVFLWGESAGSAMLL
jgi:hypothetical protein